MQALPRWGPAFRPAPCGLEDEGDLELEPENLNLQDEEPHISHPLSVAGSNATR